MKVLELLRNVLLVSLLAMLTYVLYKRMMHLMRKQHTQQKFPNLPNKLHWNNDHATIAVELKKEMTLKVELFQAEGNAVKCLADATFPKGDHIFEFSKNDLPAGKYYYKITSPFEEASQYFQI